MLLLAQISDLHLDGTERASTRARRVVDHLRALPRPVDALLVTGDIADHGDPAEYEEAAALLHLPFPVLTCPGNHDERAAYRKTLLGGVTGDADSGPINQLYTVGGTAILMCDATIPGQDEGLLDPETVDWLRRTLDAVGDMPTLIAFHQPPVTLHHPLPDQHRLRNADEFAALIADRPNVVAVLTGHAHTPAATWFAGRPLVVGPAVTWTLRMPWEGDSAADRDAPPALAYHVLDGSRLTTHFRVVV
ncbi:phosphodiesterase [Micromonospora krabiensis]|uniref:Calcineurin-like phosphoesterase n=1 Tax=Micromonospora krabiensis TaxID=307121 RepID=A0A1C3N6W8_9ACTN|nr:phosphodiesterase [Micromonospora krabiensis]SBV28342.1 Calcineurin-like phosphoesterase [Micromonospora krabiensis]